MFLLRRPDANQLDALWNEGRNSSFSYQEVGATSRADLPGGYRHDRRIVSLGSGIDPFERAASALRGWEVHARSGLRIFPPAQELAPDVTVLVVLRLGILTVVAPCRVVYVVDDATSFGFAYGTLPGHPEQGEESFIVERSADDEVRFEVSAFSRAREPLVRMGGPISWRVQKRAATAYLNAMRAIAEPRS